MTMSNDNELSTNETLAKMSATFGDIFSTVSGTVNAYNNVTIFTDECATKLLSYMQEYT